MSDIFLNHETVTQATDDMVQANQKMVTNLEELVQGLASMQQSFQGNAAKAWTDFQQVANSAADRMNQDFGKGAQTLDTIHGIHINADNRGSAIFGG